MSSVSKQVRHEAQRGLIVRVLVEWRLEWMPFGELRLQLLRRTGTRVDDEELQGHLNYLTQAGYAETKRLRAALAELELTAVRGTAKAVDLVEGRLPPDPALGL